MINFSSAAIGCTCERFESCDSVAKEMGPSVIDISAINWLLVSWSSGTKSKILTTVFTSGSASRRYRTRWDRWCGWDSGSDGMQDDTRRQKLIQGVGVAWGLEVHYHRNGSDGDAFFAALGDEGWGKE